MSGHSKWSTIKRKKAANDSRRGQLFTKILKEVTVAARLGGGDADGNPRLRAAIQEARVNNVPGDNIDRAIKKGTGELEGVSYEEVAYEGYGPGGVAILVEAMTDNKNRTVSEVRHLFSKHGGSLGEAGCVNWMFDQRGYFLIDPGTMSEEAFIRLALELEVDDISTDKGGYEMFTSPSDYLAVKEALAEREVPVAAAELALLPQSYVAVEDDKIPQVLRIVEALEDLDDVQNVWSNADVDESVLEAQTS